jgi:hypothetical protein
MTSFVARFISQRFAKSAHHHAGASQGAASAFAEQSPP